MSPDGSDQVPIAAQPAWGYSPAWAPHRMVISFTRSQLHVMDADGSHLRQVGSEHAEESAWSPDATKLVFSDYSRILVRDADGAEPPVVIAAQPYAPGQNRSPDWSPDGTRIAFTRSWFYPATTYSPASDYANLIVVDPDGSNETELTVGNEFYDASPSISPDGQTIVFSRGHNPAYETGERADLYTIPIGGGIPAQLTNTPDYTEGDPVWSPDGTKIAFTAGQTGNTDIYVMNADGTGREQLTTSLGADSGASWRGSVSPPAPGFSRPKSAVQVRVPLVPAYQECTAPNRTHGPPLAFDSCNPPQEALAADGSSRYATIGTPDVNGHPTRSQGDLFLTPVVGNPSTPADEADVRIRFSLTDVRDAANPSAGYPWSLAIPLPLRLTDRGIGCCAVPGTVRDLRLHTDTAMQVEAPCAPAGPGLGATCSVTTTYDTILPGAVLEGKRSLWHLTGPLQVYDSGADGYASSTDDNGLVATQGLFVP